MDEQMGVLASQDAQQGQPQGKPDPRMLELMLLVVARVRDALAKVAKDLDVALKADPVQGAVQFGTRALRSVAQAAEQAGKTLPFEVILGAGIQAAKDIGEVAMDKGYLQEADLEVFLKEVLQQSMTAYAEMDAQEGLIKPEDAQAVAAKAGSAQAAPTDEQAAEQGGALERG